jgi:ribosome-associated heat shock protein Hsp15
MAPENSRIDKWLWCVRFYKTRTLAAAACRGGKVKVHGLRVKAAKELLVGDTIEIKAGIVNRSFLVTAFPRSRVSASAKSLFVQETTPQPELVKLEELRRVSFTKSEKGSGRPTKKQRRSIHRLTGG